MATRMAKINPSANGHADHSSVPFGLNSDRIRDVSAGQGAVDVPPHNPSHEQAVLGAVMFDGAELDGVRRVISDPRAFYGESTRSIYRAICSLADDGNEYASFDAVLIRDRMERLENATDHTTRDLLRAMEAPSDSHNATYYARLVQADFMRRRTAEIGREITRQALTPGADAVEIVTAAENTFRGLSESRATREKFPAISLGDLLAKEFPPSQWIAGEFIREHETCFWIAPPKTLKTTLIIALAVAAASGGMFLRRFPCRNRRRVLLLLGETPEEAAKLMLQRACEAAGVDPDTVADSIHIHCGVLPHVASEADLLDLKRLCEKHRPDLIVMDPFYLAADGLEFSRLEVVGPRIRAIADAVMPGTLLIAHHTTKGETKQVGKVLDMGSGTGTGFQAACGQWIIVNREEEYDPQSSDWHILNMSWGGRGGHGGRLLIRYRESTGEIETDLMGSREDQLELRDQERTAKKIAERETRMNSARNVISGILKRSATPLSGRAIEAALRLSASDWTTIGQTLCRDAISDMDADLTILKCQHRATGKLQEGFIHRDDRQRFQAVPEHSILDPDPTIGGAS